MLCPDEHGRRSIRLPGFDYRQAGAYFVTIVTHGRECLLDDVEDGEVRLSSAGQIVAHYWAAMLRRFPGVALDRWVVMPNHVHAIIVIGEGTAMWVASGFIGRHRAKPQIGFGPEDKRYARRARRPCVATQPL